MLGKSKKVDRDVNQASSKNDTKRSYYDEAIDWDISRTKVIESSERRAWIICTVLLLMLLCSWGGLFFLLPLKKDIPYVVQVDKATGRSEVTEVYNPKRLGVDEIRDKYWINYFVNLYERYNYYLLREDYRNMPLFAEGTVWEDYQKFYRGEGARQKIYRDNVRVDVDIISILVRQGKPKTASVRFRVSKVDLKTAGNPVLDSRIFTVELVYEYETLALSEKNRLVNPLGFRVKSYQLAADNN